MTFCSKCLSPITKKDRNIIDVVKGEYLKDNTPWYIGYSGGKDSSAVLTLVFNALLEIEKHHKPVEIVYCDTGVEIPTISRYVKTTLEALKFESLSLHLPFKVTIAKPKLDDRYFVKVIGRGYP